MMSEVSTVYTTPVLIDVANASHDFHTSNEQKDDDVLSQAERSEFLRYPRNFFDRITGALPKDEEAASCLWAYNPIMAVVMQTWYLRTVRQC